MSDVTELEATYRKVINYIKTLRGELDDKLNKEFSEDQWTAKEEAKSGKYHNDVENIKRFLDYSKKLYDKIEELRSHNEGVNKDTVKLQTKLLTQLFKETRKHNVQYTGNSQLFKDYKITQKTFSNAKPSIVTESMTSPIGMLYNFSKFHGDKVVMINPLSISRGGCVMHGQRGIEEDLCLQTNYWKVLGRFVKDDVYEVSNIGDMIYAPHVTKIRNRDFKWLTREQRTQANMIGVKFPYRLDSLMVKERATYGNESDRQTICDVLDKVLSLCVDRGHEMVIFNNIGTGSISYPEDDFIDILLEKINKYKFKIFVFCGYSGDIDGHDKYDRLRWIKYCKQLDNSTDYIKRRDVQEPIYIEPSKLMADKERKEDKEEDSGSEAEY